MKIRSASYPGPPLPPHLGLDAIKKGGIQMDSNYCATYHFFYRIEKEAGWGEDYKGNPAAIYTEIKVHKAIKSMTEKEFYKIHEKHRTSMAAQLKINVDYVIPIGRNEYLENTDDEED